MMPVVGSALCRFAISFGDIPMDAFLSDIFTNILANIIFWVLGGVIIGILLGRRRRKLFRFFGIAKNRPITVYLTSLPIARGSVIDSYGVPSRYQGLALHGSEFQVIPQITSLFMSNLFQNIPDIFSGLVDNLWLLRKPVIDILLSPKKQEEIRRSSSICVGGPKFNLTTEYYLRTGNPFIIMVRDQDAWIVKVARGSRSDEVLSAPDHWDIGVVLKLIDLEQSSTIFIVGGTGSNGTRAAVEYLVLNWEILYRSYKQAEFGIGLRCPNREIDPEGYKRPEILIKLPH